MKLYYKSTPKAFIDSAPLHFKNWVPRTGPNGRRLVIDTFWLVFDATALTVAGTAVEGEDVYRVFKRIEVEQVGGRKRWNLRGDETRLALYQLLPSNRVPEFADIAIAAGQAIQARIPIPMAKHYGKRGRDFALPAELLAKVTIEAASLSEVGVGGGTVSAVTATYYIIAECHEEESVELHAEDEVRSQPFTNTSGGQLVVQGKLQALGIFARGASGGASLANFTDIRIDQMLPDTFAKADLTDLFAAKRGCARNLQSTDGGAVRNNPFTLATPLAIPVLWEDEETRVFDGPAKDEVTVRMTNTVADTIAVMRVVTPKSEAVARAVSSRHGIARGDWSMKTKKGSRKRQASWARRGGDALFMPTVAPDPKDRAGA